MGKPTSQWASVNGGVPQGTLSGPELFIHMLSDFKTVVADVKFVDDSTLVDTGKKKEKSDRMQEAANQAASWSEKNNLGINESKTKEMIVWFGKNNDIPPLELNGKEIE
jgi:dsDNA-binding SOS-regulon protein